ncbi:MAG: helix-turn-helix domain-containing protein [Roseburia sp.]|nr:helix-turn-helix domain-containing protein [Anaeroplasma bactoclasticum]MCM1195531.1 helix-turn-helix domain-containing protein [Roseburia sp.]MCM1556906.1 helix-turn-helix domain-containing protein [Anaeroplasma bactoclasticum]
MTFEELVKNRGFTQESLGKVMNKTHTTIYRWCRGKSEPSCASIAKLAVVLNSSIEELVMIFANKNKEE